MTLTLAEFKEKFAKNTFGMTKKEAHEKGVCINCKQPIAPLIDPLDENEYRISGLCPSCHEDITGVPV